MSKKTNDGIPDRQNHLSPRNEDVACVNATIFIYVHGTWAYLLGSTRRTKMENGAIGLIGWPSESLNAMNPSCLASFKLDLRVGCTNDTKKYRAQRRTLQHNETKSRVVSTSHNKSNGTDGRQTWIIGVHPSDISHSNFGGGTSYNERRSHFPLRMEYAMTINKSQGKSVKFVGID